MASQSERVAGDFLKWYAEHQPDNESAAVALEKYIARVMADANLRALLVAARAKRLDSVRAKLLRKPYRRPRSQLTDRLGLRIIVYHARDVDLVSELMRAKLDVREAQSSDKRLALGLREFGYRSYHLIASLPTSVSASPELWSLRGAVFEVQIRSLLEHAWAEIEHDVVYKSGVEWPPQIKRRFAAIAGVLELLEHEFYELSAATSGLVNDAVAALKEHVDKTLNLDVPYMCALLEIERPEGLSFRRAQASGEAFPPGIEQRLHLALHRSGIRTTGAFLLALRSPWLRRAIRTYAREEGIPAQDVSHLAVAALVIGSRSSARLSVFFPEFAAEQSLRAALRRKSSSRPRAG